MPSYDILSLISIIFKVSTASSLGYNGNFDNALSKLTIEQKKTIYDHIHFY